MYAGRHLAGENQSSRALELLTTLYTTKTMMNYSLCNRLLVVFALLSNISLQIVVCLTYNYGDGSYYVGEVDDFGLPSGTGKFYNTSGNLEYDGDWHAGTPDGNGTWYGGDGSVYVGSFRYGRSSGPAVMTYASGDIATGDFLDMRPHGHVQFRAAPDNANSADTAQPEKILTIKGQFRHGMAHGDVKILYMVPQVIPVSRDPTTTMQSTTVGVIRTKVVIEGTFRMGLPHGVITVRKHRPDSEIKEDKNSLIAEGKFLYGRLSIDEQMKNWRTTLLEKCLTLLKKKVVI